MRRNLRSLPVAALLLAPFAVQLGFALGMPGGGPYGGPWLLFGIVVVAASLCAVVAGLVMWRAYRTNAPELSWIGLFFYSVSVLPLVHGITTPGALYGPNDATMASVVLAIPLGVTAAAPIAFGRSHPIARPWKAWTISWIAIITGVAAFMLVAPNVIPLLNARSLLGGPVVAASVIGCVLLGLRQVRLARIAQRGGPLVVAAGIAMVGGSAAVLFGSEPYSLGFWLAHALDISGVFAGAIGAWVVYRRSESMQQMLAPIVAVDPVAALEVGMHPDVVAFIGRLEHKDQRTRDHVVRTAELAIEVAGALGLPPDTQRAVGLGGALHDIGKLQIPDEILNKPGQLNEVEWRFMKAHAAVGADMVARSEPLAELAPIVRGHHERVDGRGYPDGLVGEEIPIEARIVAACDAFDAMAYTRSYRDGMQLEAVVDVLRKNSGTQWDPRVVEAVIAIATRKSPEWAPRLLGDGTSTHVRCDCLPEGVDVPGACQAADPLAQGVLVTAGQRIEVF